MIWDVALAKHFPHARNPFDLQVQFCSDAKRLVLFGPSGAGKTLTLKMIAGLIQTDSGYVSFAGERLLDLSASINMSPQQRQLGYVFQDYALFPHLTVQKNIAFGLHAVAVESWIKKFGLESVQHHYPHQISGGQRQRTALARALATRPRALLLDEPFAALDKPLRERLRNELLELQAEMNIPLLLITHDEEDVRYFGEQVLCMEDGRMVTTQSVTM